ncbi:MAG: hypothetical protein HOP99_04470 [Dermatophilaceae bacterium]|nr:hypothetical protein [Dermatophilaceae bacterium]
MAWSVGRATWVGDVTDPDIAQQVGTRTFDRGQAYAAERRVRSLATRPDGLMLLGTIEGSGSGEHQTTYQTIIEARPHPKGRSHLWSGRCSCPVGSDCKHVVALMLTARDVAHGVALGPPDEPEAVATDAAVAVQAVTALGRRARAHPATPGRRRGGADPPRAAR